MRKGKRIHLNGQFGGGFGGGGGGAPVPPQQPQSQQQPTQPAQPPVPPQQQPPFFQQQQAPLAPTQGSPGYAMERRFTAQDGVPQELIGKTVAEAMQYYNQLRQLYLNTQNRVRQQQVQQSAQQPRQQGGQFAPQLPNQSQGGQNGQLNIQEVIQSAVSEATLPQQIRENFQQARTLLPGFAEHEAEVLQTLSLVQDRAALANMDTWTTAYALVVGRKAIAQMAGGAGQGGAPAQQQGVVTVQPAPLFQQQPAQAQQPPTVPQQNQMAPSFQQLNGGWQPAGSFFTEQPGQPTFAGQVQLTQEEVAIAEKFGMSPQQYAAAKIASMGGGNR